MHWKLMTDRDFLGACDLQGRDVPCTIAKVEQGTLKRAGSSKSDRKPVLTFERGSKKFVLNVTNATTIAAMYGPNTEGWCGKRIVLYATTTKLKGQEVECVRVRPRPPGAKQQDAATATEPAPELHAEFTRSPLDGPSDDEQRDPPAATLGIPE